MCLCKTILVPCPRAGRPPISIPAAYRYFF
uniref:Uncharacterized protein n=1 Tax=Arundo donax TaxID=35708 RepID=A0A0A8ZE04_ARUDO